MLQTSYMKLAIIEDEEGAAALLHRHLSLLFDDSCEVVIAHNITDAKRLIFEKGPFDIIFLDLNLMPDSPADQTIKEIPTFLQHCKQIVIVSGLDRARYEEEALKLGALGYMSKAEALSNTRTFIEKLVDIYRTWRGESTIEINLYKLERILNKSPHEGTERTGEG